jgi:hypothetical protein
MAGAAGACGAGALGAAADEGLLLNKLPIMDVPFVRAIRAAVGRSFVRRLNLPHRFVRVHGQMHGKTNRLGEWLNG